MESNSQDSSLIDLKLGKDQRCQKRKESKAERTKASTHSDRRAQREGIGNEFQELRRVLVFLCDSTFKTINKTLAFCGHAFKYTVIAVLSCFQFVVFVLCAAGWFGVFESRYGYSRTYNSPPSSSVANIEDELLVDLLSTPIVLLASISSHRVKDSHPSTAIHFV
ncbi:hypothetical protein NC653_016181 [Populus alba x Populus x berolinensis]|nr:hypothetical protein NC653_016181 [Populus alba x Populus x berolinensis]